MTTSEDLFHEIQNHLLNARQSSYEQFDKAILTLSTGGLGLSLVFIKDIIPLAEAVCISLLLTSWVLFVAAILSTLSSFVLSQYATDKQLYYAEQYYLHKKEEYHTKRNPFATATKVSNIVSGACFFVAVVCTVTFASINIKQEQSMSNPIERLFQNGYVPPRMQADTSTTEHIERGYVPGQMPKVPATTPAAGQPNTTPPAAPPSKESGK